ncbi:hypothetical protein VNI00_017296 [Paramarasmius palmivorus]|uniref:Uncharacterized protein n=1 Tax=Paramarasmius palmivorus TaxID=297713 RepID=A0AAW0B827_9AGAR
MRQKLLAYIVSPGPLILVNLAIHPLLKMIIRPRVIAFLFSLAFLALADPFFDFVLSSLMVVPSTATVNIPAIVKWKNPSPPMFPFNKFQIIFVQDSPVTTSSVIEMDHKLGQTEGTIPFTATRAGRTYHLEASGYGTSARVEGNITVTEPRYEVLVNPQYHPINMINFHGSTTQTDTFTSENSIPSTSQPVGPTSTTFSEAIPVATTVASGSPEIPTANPHDTTPRSRIGVIFGTTIGLLFGLAAIAIYVWYQRSFAGKRAEHTDHVSPYTYSSEKNGSRKERLNLVSNAPHIPESHGATTGQNEGEDEEVIGEESTLDHVVVYHYDSERRPHQRTGHVRVLEIPPSYHSEWRER